jgi:RNA polymerase sigma-70 factor (ECF subfamily)
MADMPDELQRELPALLPRLWRFALRLARERADAEDLVQRCCVRALERRSQWRPSGSLLSWLFSIMHSIWLNEVRSRQARGRWNVHWEQEEAELCADAHATDPAQRALYGQVAAWVDALPAEQRDVLLLVAVEGLSYKEAAQVLQVPLGTVMSRLARARLAIGKRLAESPTAQPGATAIAPPAPAATASGPLPRRACSGSARTA